MATEPNRSLPLDGLTIAVVGAGRIGSELVRNPGLMGIGRIDVFRRDHHAADPVRSRYAVYDGDFRDTLTLARLQGYDFAVCTVNNLTARQRMNQKCLVANTNLVQAWTEGTLAIVGAYPFAVLPDCACCDCESSRGAVPMPSAALKLSVAEAPAMAGPATRIATKSANRARRPLCHEQQPAVTPATDRQGCGGGGAAGCAGAGAEAGWTLSPEDGLTGSGAPMISKRSTK